MTTEAWRDLFPVTRTRIFLNNAAMAPPSLRVVEAMHAFMSECAKDASLHYASWGHRVQTVRAKAAALVGAKPEDLAFTGNTSCGLSLVAQSFPWREGDAVLVPVPDFPSNVYPWQNLGRRGVQVIEVPRRAGRIERADVERHLTPRVRMLALSSVDYAGGHAADLEDLGAWCRERGLFFVVDAIQSLGVLPMDASRLGIHALACGAHKWLLGPMGIGLLYVGKELRGQLQPVLAGWKSVVDPENFELHFQLREDAALFEPGTLNLAGIFGLGAALDLLAEVGAATVRARVFALYDQLAAGLEERRLPVTSPRAPEQRAGLLFFAPPGSPETLFRALLRRGVMLSLRNGRLRLSPHFYNNEADVAAFFTALDDWLKK
ncbi:aminotransferase class V-fold PLP-dependent enzyme [Geoalkalibacter halelectricus]|uniref:Aminotransferase class V-fold PLP-dependent enzyme n=1 Tax=Geoalkalibacter halelectricus TaxID=2847045 RepID=A0ABY5ZKR2_9BACT|nr:aminotransferase class V-fold PLP-dependent enzyme [Geoalkalibacter halelectricus]MDO3378928.1 aminotransferase class V-fold PLP-dependent enzyme [Geoalkalibacter halelectricus]UWZ79049.1 aminotransferase class V-fold PLP-dependent enzyme [Geoalkalibacter halelectricus]